ncbi:P-II family nitrogen regulator, partial [Bartonella bacilliformis]
MKTTEAIIKSFKFDEMKKMLQKIVLYKITVTRAKNFGRQKKHTELYSIR